jgi:hypothetical protein
MAGVPIVFTFIVTTHVMSERNHGRSGIDPISIMMPIVILVCLLILPSALREQQQSNVGTKIDAREGRLEAVEGVLGKSHMMGKSSLTLSLKLNDETFEVSEDPLLFATLVEGCRYRAYVAQNSRRLMIIELLEGPALQSF